MRCFGPTLLDRLFDDGPLNPVVRRLTLDELKESVARDLESLLNTRLIQPARQMEQFPLARLSLASYGLKDFSSMSLCSFSDREAICEAIRFAIETHEPRLREVQVSLLPGRLPHGQLTFGIKAWLVVRPASEPVGFDATLQPTTLQYAVADAAGTRGSPI